MLAMVALSFSASSALGQALPADLLEAAARHGCRPVAEFYDRPGMIEAPFVYGFLPGEKDESVAFWCERPGADTAYVLVFVTSGRAARVLTCASELRWPRFPDGLSLAPEREVSLDGFRSVQGNRAVPLGRRTTWPPIVSSYDGVSALFYCLDGRWVYMTRH